MKFSNLLLIAVSALFISTAFHMRMENINQDPWDIPTKYLKMENPTDPSDSEGITIGRQLYSKHCKSCHGKEGKGDGTKAAELKTSCGDFTTDAFKASKDGELYFKSIIGRDEMPNFEKKIPSEEDRWLVINYMRTFGN